MTINIISREDDTRDHLAEIVAKLNERFARIKAANPDSYLDAYESQIDSLYVEVAAEMGGRIEHKDGETVFNFTRYAADQIATS